MVLKLPVKNDFITGFIDFMTFKIANNEDVMSAQKIIVKFRELLDAKKINFICDSFSVDSVTGKNRFGVIMDTAILRLMDILISTIYVIDESNADPRSVIGQTISISEFKLTIDDKELVDNNSDKIIQYVSADTILVKSFNNSWLEARLPIHNDLKKFNNLYVWWKPGYYGVSITEIERFDPKFLLIGKITLVNGEIVNIENLDIPLFFVCDGSLVVQGGKRDKFEWNPKKLETNKMTNGYYYIVVCLGDKQNICIIRQRPTNPSYLILGLIKAVNGKIDYCVEYDFNKDGLISFPNQQKNYFIVHEGSCKIGDHTIAWNTQQYYWSGTNYWAYVAINKNGTVSIDFKPFDKENYFTIGLVMWDETGYHVSYDLDSIIRKKDNTTVTVRAGSININGGIKTWKTTDLVVGSTNYNKFYIGYVSNTLTGASDWIESNENYLLGFVITDQNEIVHIHNGSDNPIMDKKGYIRPYNRKDAINDYINVKKGKTIIDNKVVKWNGGNYSVVWTNTKKLVAVNLMGKATDDIVFMSEATYSDDPKKYLILGYIITNYRGVLIFIHNELEINKDNQKIIEKSSDQQSLLAAIINKRRDFTIRIRLICSDISKSKQILSDPIITQDKEVAAKLTQSLLACQNELYKENDANIIIKNMEVHLIPYFGKHNYDKINDRNCPRGTSVSVVIHLTHDIFETPLLAFSSM